MTQKTKMLRVIFNFLLKTACVASIFGIGIILLTKSTAINDATIASLLTLIIGALGVSVGYTAREKSEPTKKETLEKE